MIMIGISLKEVSDFIDTIRKLRKLPTEKLHEKLETDTYKNWILDKIRFLNYSANIQPDDFVCYRVRENKQNEPFTSKSDLLYPPKDKITQGRMNNKYTTILYTSLNEFTAISEAKLKVESYFQLTRFKITKQVNIFSIGRFSNLFFNIPRNSTTTTELIKEIASGMSNSAIKEFAALECAVIDVLYSNNSDNDYILSSFIADAIFVGLPAIDAIMYPTMQNKFGTNFAIKKDYVDNHLELNYSNFNRITESYENGFFKYQTLYECFDFSNPDNLKFETPKNSDSQYY